MGFWRLLLGESLFIALAGLLALLGMFLAGFIAGGWGPVLGLFILILCAGLLASWRTSDAVRLIRWLRHIAEAEEPRVDANGDEEGPGAPALRSPLRHMVRPAYEVAQLLTERDKRLRRQERSLGTIVAAVPDPILVVDRHRVVDLANPAADRSFGVRLRGLSLTRAIRDPGVLAAVDAAIGTGSASNVSFSPTLDRTKLFVARVMPISLSNGLPGVLLALREQSEHLLIERMRTDFVANASHEIRTPLASIIGITETLQGPAKDDTAAREMFLDTMAEEARRMQRLIDDLLSLSKIEFAANQPPEQVVDLQGIAREVTDRLAASAARVGSKLMIEAEQPLPAVLGDHDQLHQLLVNLIDNAIKYGAGKPVEISLRYLSSAGGDAGPMTGRPCVEIAVRDYGEGIAPEHLGRLTERFYRVDKARSRRIGGTGLGLAIVKHIVRRHQGHLGIDSRLGQGSSFSVLLPMPERVHAEAKSARAGSDDHKTVTHQS